MGLKETQTIFNIMLHNYILDGGKQYFVILFFWVKTGTVPVFRWCVTGSNLQGHQIQVVGSESPTLGPLKANLS
jgi:hypothetical protein